MTRLVFHPYPDLPPETRLQRALENIEQCREVIAAQDRLWNSHPVEGHARRIWIEKMQKAIAEYQAMAEVARAEMESGERLTAAAVQAAVERVIVANREKQRVAELPAAAE